MREKWSKSTRVSCLKFWVNFVSSMNILRNLYRLRWWETNYNRLVKLLRTFKTFCSCSCHSIYEFKKKNFFSNYFTLEKRRQINFSHPFENNIHLIWTIAHMNTNNVQVYWHLVYIIMMRNLPILFIHRKWAAPIVVKVQQGGRKINVNKRLNHLNFILKESSVRSSLFRNKRLMLDEKT